MIKSKSLYAANIVFLFKESSTPPENAEFTNLFSGEVAKGINFMDNPAMMAKLMDVPKLGLSVVWEGKRLRVEDRQSKEPEESLLVNRSHEIFGKLYKNRANELAGFGFNFDMFFQLKDVIRINELFTQIHPASMETGDSLLDLGWQWTLSYKGGDHLEGYFVKITAPLEIAVHHNSHHKANVLPSEKELQKLFSAAYGKITRTIEGLSL